VDSLSRILRAPLYLRAVGGLSAYLFAMGGLGFWAPTFLFQRYGLELAAANAAAGSATIVGGIGGTAIGGIWADRLAKKREAGTPSARDDLRICAIGTSIAAPLGMLALLAPTAKTCLAIFFVCEIALFISTAPINAVLLHTVPNEVRASAMAVCIFAMHFFGDLWSPPIVGALADRMPIQWAMMLNPCAIAVCAALWWVPHREQAAPRI
jgi:MFS family permease